MFLNPMSDSRQLLVIVEDKSSGVPEIKQMSTPTTALSWLASRHILAILTDFLAETSIPAEGTFHRLPRLHSSPDCLCKDFAAGVVERRHFPRLSCPSSPANLSIIGSSCKSYLSQIIPMPGPKFAAKNGMQ